MLKNILLILDGNVGNKLLDRLKNDLSGNAFHIVTSNVTRQTLKGLSSRFTFHEFDPTSNLKITNLIKKYLFSHIAIALRDNVECQETLHHIRFIDKYISISLLDSVDITIDDPNTFIVHSNTIMANQMVDTLPDVPRIAKNIGLGEGEIMEVLIPFGSSYAYKNIKRITQKDWLITMIYRNNEMILPSKNIFLQPNDTAIITGKPHILHHVYKSINNKLGQFPAPYGKNLYFIIDLLDICDIKRIYTVLRNLAILSSRLKNSNLIIKIINPTSGKLIGKLKQDFEDKYGMIIDVSYKAKVSTIDIIKGDILKFNIGLIIVTAKMFLHKGMTNELFNLKIPIFKLGQEELAGIRRMGVLIKEESNYEVISSTVFDLASQFNLSLTLYDIDPEAKSTQYIIEHYRTIGKMFNKSFDVQKSKANPILEFRKQNNILQITPFTKNLLTTSLVDMLMSTDFEKHLHKLSKFNQILIPIA
jgi:hypothetical protein